ncbi:MAG TPA: lysine--tRNA ligase [Acidimicrobiia bacterium]|nr:lysine--tRNA ligase [Acidimicrobiia bacterium]
MPDLFDGSDDLTSPLEAHPLTAARLAKLQAWEAAGMDPYPPGSGRTHTTQDVRDRHSGLGPGEETDDVVCVAGRVRLARSFGKLLFLTIEDGHGQLQLFFSKADLAESDFTPAELIEPGDWVEATGPVMTTRKGELSVKVGTFRLLAKGLRPLPDKWHGLTDVEERSRHRYVDLIVNPDARKVAITRARVVSALRQEFEARGYVEVETPILQVDAGGALARPFTTHHNALDIGLFLRIATELHLKRLIVGGMERVFEVGRIFRNEGIDSTHNPEFTMLESYEAFADYNDIMSMVEEIFASVAIAAAGSTDIEYQGRPMSLSGPYRRGAMSDLVSEAVGTAVSVHTPAEELSALARDAGIDTEDEWGAGKLIEELFGAMVEQTIWEPTFVTDYPVEISPLARRHRDDPALTERFELFIAGAEYANAFTELNDPRDQRVRFLAQAAAKAAGDDEAHPIDEDYIRALEYGMPPTGGLGIGVDRLVMLLTDQVHIREVILFPTMRPSAD